MKRAHLCEAALQPDAGVGQHISGVAVAHGLRQAPLLVLDARRGALQDACGCNTSRLHTMHARGITPLTMQQLDRTMQSGKCSRGEAYF